MTHTITFNLLIDESDRTIDLPVSRAIIAGWTGRDTDAMEAHIKELEELGVARPARTPMFYRVSTSRLTTADRIEVIGDASSGEAEFMLVNIDGEIFVGCGSDHTDREAETVGVTLSKQMCDKPIASSLWRLSDVSDHWSELHIRSFISENDRSSVAYQDGSVEAMLAPEDLLERFKKEDAKGGLSHGDIMMCGTLPAIGGVRPSSHFSFALVDPVLDRTITHGYQIQELPIEG